jgi:hypothetical protein
MGKQKEMYEKEMGRVEWFPHGVADWQFLPVNPDVKGIIFIGNNYEHFSGARERAEVCKKLKEVYGDEFKIYGNGWGDIGEGTIPFEQNHIYYNKALVGIDGSIFNDKDGYFSHRPMQIMAAGSACCVRAIPSIRACFPLHWTWSAFDQLREMIDYYKNSEIARNFAVNQQQEYVRSHYHWDVLADKFDKILFPND